MRPWYSASGALLALTWPLERHAGAAWPTPGALLLHVDADGVRASGGYLEADGSAFPWRLAADHVVRLAFKRDYGTVWRHGSLVSTTRCRRTDMQALAQAHFSATVLGGDNRVDCDTCCQRCEHESRLCVAAAPPYLAVHLARMTYRTDLGRTVKHMAHVALDPVLVLPAPADTDEATLRRAAAAANSGRSDASAAALQPETGHAAKSSASARAADDGAAGVPATVSAASAGYPYGLYAVIIHRGDSANSGHYYTIARRSDARGGDLSARDTPAAPWVQFNDTQVTTGLLWEEWTQALARSATDRAYVLLYRRLPAPSESPQPAEALARAGTGPGAGTAGVHGRMATPALPPLPAAEWTTRVLLDNVRLVAGLVGGDHSRHYADLADEVAAGIAATADLGDGPAVNGTPAH
jgi:hypothetical protein